MIFHQLFESETSTYSYLLGCPNTHRALLIDPVLSEIETYLTLLERLGLTLFYTLETHVHADHITGSGALRERLGSHSVVHQAAGTLCPDLLVSDGVRLQMGSLELKVLYTPGHTQSCVSYWFGDRVFTGDALLIGGCGRTDFQQGNPGQLFDSIHHQLFTLPPDTLVYPGHDYQGLTVSTIRQEMQKNARLGQGIQRDDFIELMNRLDLPLPKHIHAAVPANLACGQIDTTP